MEDLKAKICVNCEDTICDDDHFTHDHETYCEECYHDTFSTCIHCDDVTITDDGFFQDDEFYCQDCFEERFTACEECGDFIRRDHAYGQDDSDYCENCYNDLYTCCDDCGYDILLDSSYHTDNGTYCEECYTNNENSNNLESYCYKPSPVFFGTKYKNKTNLYLGIELECDKGDDFDVIDDLRHNELYFKEDSSLDNGFEMVSHPMTLEYHQYFNWKGILKQIRQSGFRSFNAGTCGLHIHIPKNLLTPSEQIKLSMMVYTNPEFFQKLSQRDSNYSKYKKLKGVHGANFNHDRFEAINFQNSNTIEFRMFKGTLKYESFISAIELVHSLVMFIKTAKTSDIYKSDMFKSEFRNGIAFRSFCVFVVNNQKTYTHLKQYMIDKKAFVVI
jgi:hypothetical protein